MLCLFKMTVDAVLVVMAMVPSLGLRRRSVLESAGVTRPQGFVLPCLVTSLMVLPVMQLC